jgi:hypothetical protein
MVCCYTRRRSRPVSRQAIGGHPVETPRQRIGKAEGRTTLGLTPSMVGPPGCAISVKRFRQLVVSGQNDGRLKLVLAPDVRDDPSG